MSNETQEQTLREALIEIGMTDYSQMLAVALPEWLDDPAEWHPDCVAYVLRIAEAYDAKFDRQKAALETPF